MIIHTPRPLSCDPEVVRHDSPWTQEVAAEFARRLGCTCSPESTLTETAEGGFDLTISHDHDCPVLLAEMARWS